jgi:hypothetical protein
VCKFYLTIMLLKFLQIFFNTLVENIETMYCNLLVVG